MTSCARLERSRRRQRVVAFGSRELGTAEIESPWELNVLDTFRSSVVVTQRKCLLHARIARLVTQMVIRARLFFDIVRVSPSWHN